MSEVEADMYNSIVSPLGLLLYMLGRLFWIEVGDQKLVAFKVICAAYKGANILEETVNTNAPVASVNPAVTKSAEEIVIVLFTAYPVPIEATATADKASAPFPVMVSVAPVPAPEVEV